MDATAPRRRFQFSLRALLIAVTALAVWLGLEVNRVRRQREAVEAIIAAGGKVHYDYEMAPGRSNTPDAEPAAPRWLRKLIGEDFFRDVVDVDLNRTQINDEWLIRLNDLPKIERLNLAYTSVSDSGFERLTGLRNLRSAIPDETRCTDRSLAHLAAASPDLRELAIGGSGVTDAGLAEIARFKRLRTLVLTGAEITDEGLRQIEALGELEMLWIAEAPITDRGLQSVARLKKLKRLFLFGSEITDEGVKRLEELDALQRLAIMQSPITDRGIEPLKKLKWLSQLELYETLVTDSGAAELAVALPMCKISTAPPP